VRRNAADAHRRLTALASNGLTDRERAVADALMATFAPPGYDRETTTAALTAALSRLAPHRLAKLRTLLGLFDGPLLSLVLAGRFASFVSLDLANRERVLRALADSPIAQLRSGFQAFKRLCAFLAYAAVDAGGRNPLWPGLGYRGPRDDRPAAGDRLPLLVPRADRLECDVVVVGSGAGGGVAAALFSNAGRRVVVLEAGPPADAVDVRQFEAEAFATMYLDSALTSTEDLGVAILAGACVGGGTTVNWCTSLRLAPRVAAQWSDAAGGIDFDASLAPHYDAVAARLDVRTTSAHNRNNDVLLQGCRALGWHQAEIPRNASGCGDGCGYCGFGCAYRNKRSTAETYLRDAVVAGASVVARARVDRIVIDHGHASGVEATVDGPEGPRALSVRAPLVVLGAGSLRTPGLLRRGGVASPHLGRHLKLHPTTAVFAQFDEPVQPWIGPMQTVVSDRFGDLDDGYGAKLEAVPAHPGLAALGLSWRSRAQHLDVMTRSRFAAALIVLTRDRGEGLVTLDERTDIHYAVDPYDGAHMLAALAGLAEIVFAAGATSLLTLHTDPIELSRKDASKEGLAAFARELSSRGTSANRLGVFSAHQMGTCRMHRDPASGVVDENGAVHGVEGLLVADASVFPLASGVNPMLTIMALAHRSVSHHASA
jgi:choline dehydrogenase-like flavoprotein